MTLGKDFSLHYHGSEASAHCPEEQAGFDYVAWGVTCISDTFANISKQ